MEEYSPVAVVFKDAVEKPPVLLDGVAVFDKERIQRTHLRHAALAQIPGIIGALESVVGILDRLARYAGNQIGHDRAVYIPHTVRYNVHFKRGLRRASEINYRFKPYVGQLGDIVVSHL